MKVFSTSSQSKHWHYINTNNIHNYLSGFPYQQDKKLYAICPYCHNPIKIVSRASNNHLVFYAVHSNSPIKGFKLFDERRLKYCLLSKKPRLMFYDPLSEPAFDLALLNLDALRKDLTFYTGIFMSTKSTSYLIHHNKKALQFRDADIYNFPFALLLATEQIKLNYRKVANPRIADAIEKYSKYFILDEQKQILPKDKFDEASIVIQFKNQSISPGNFLSCNAVISESYKNSYNKIISFHIFAKMFTNLIAGKDEFEGENPL